jgi:hypothetical protein
VRQGAWVCHEKRIIVAARLGGAEQLFRTRPSEPTALLAWTGRVAHALDVPPGDAVRWVATRQLVSAVGRTV